ncbi:MULTISPECIES: vWA domain-containing protein [Gordonia]|uniref:VWA domain-containing protein n=1 Tax=Gordonia amicalis TaxID=89053 RepID=A0AAE4R7N7_9ACTN|nr:MULTISPECIES: VWA domain-containing protein [Gordonia]MBA5849390.1 VWA domain-containing protein [Gordonia amicalis]MCZ4579221.1 VWA domain-containing protein [Gordonia amicalis]MDJ0452388.1 VWA domain-containing protein [Gordonia amicalis]MDV6311830.1 VWA domain-containing protein [Gordonia amicalis]MDV7075000.1 VWA domain-containing protein [Gordonia amicalis]
MTTPLVAHLTDFVDELRRRGIVVGPSALIDAASAMEVLDLLERSRLREGLATTLLVDHAHRGVFDRVFDLWFPVGAGMRTVTEDLPRDEDGNLDVEAVRDALAEMLADDAAAGDGRLEQAIAMIVDELGRYGSTKGEAFSAYQAISAVNPQTLIAKIAAAMAGGDGARPGTEPLYRQAARQKATDLRAAIERETQRRMADRNGRDKVGAYAVPPLPENVNFLSAGAKEQVEIRKTIEPLARLLAAKLETRRRRAHRGAVDVRKTLRASMSTGGVPIELSHRKPRPGRPELIVICDVSGSVAGFSQFTLRLVYALRQQFSKVRVFAFVDTVDEVTDFFDHGEEDFGAAMHHMISTARISTRDGHSDYGNMLAGFVADHVETLTHRGALLVLGDARNNYHDAHADALAELVERARHAYWLNPEAKEHWGTGDSVATDYAEVIDMFECRNATQLGTVIADLLPV